MCGTSGSRQKALTKKDMEKVDYLTLGTLGFLAAELICLLVAAVAASYANISTSFLNSSIDWGPVTL